MIELTEAETGIFDGFQPGEGRYVLQSAAAAPVRSAEDMVGDWAIARGTGKPICTLTLANNAAGADGLALKLKPGCDPLVTRFGPTSWRIDQGELVLLSGRGQSLALRRERRQYLAARAGKSRSGSAGAAVERRIAYPRLNP